MQYTKTIFLPLVCSFVVAILAFIVRNPFKPFINLELTLVDSMIGVLFAVNFLGIASIWNKNINNYSFSNPQEILYYYFVAILFLLLIESYGYFFRPDQTLFSWSNIFWQSILILINLVLVIVSILLARKVAGVPTD